MNWAALQKHLTSAKASTVLLVVAVLGGLYLLFRHLSAKGYLGEGMSGQPQAYNSATPLSSSSTGPAPPQGVSLTGSSPYASAHGAPEPMSTANDPAQLLPATHANNVFSQANPMQPVPMDNTRDSYVNGGRMTVIRNASLDMRGDVLVIPKSTVSPFLASTIEPDHQSQFGRQRAGLACQ
jgi:hypothetical protein